MADLQAMFSTKKVTDRSVQLRVDSRVQMWQEPTSNGMGALLVLQMSRENLAMLRDVLTVTLEN